jgi:hypothetical protein
MRRDRRRRRAERAGPDGPVSIAPPRRSSAKPSSWFATASARSPASRPRSSSPACRRPGRAKSCAARCAGSPMARIIPCRRPSTTRQSSAKSRKSSKQLDTLLWGRHGILSAKLSCADEERSVLGSSTPGARDPAASLQSRPGETGSSALYIGDPRNGRFPAGAQDHPERRVGAIVGLN